MAYDLHIENSGKNIDEWKKYVESSPFLTTFSGSSTENPATGEIISVSTPGAAVAENGLHFWPRQRASGLTIKIRNPTDSDIPFLKAITQDFGGVLIGDEGEEY